MNTDHIPLPDQEDDALNQAIDGLMREEALTGSVPPEFKTAISLKASGANPLLRADFDNATQAKLLNLFAEKKASVSLWKMMFGSSFVGVAMVALMLVAVFQGNLAPEPKTLAHLQGFESLSRAEVLLGSLPVDAITEEGDSIRDLRAQIHAINAQYEAADTVLDPSMEVFPHVQLRDSALELIELESNFYNEWEATDDKQEGKRLIAFADKVHSWPTTNEGVSFEVHAKAVSGYLTHKELWEAASYELALQILEKF